MNNIINIDKQIENSTKNLPDDNYMLGRTLMQPCKPANSGSRALMASIQIEHTLVLNNGEIPILQTGYENEFGKHSTSYVISNNNYEVVNKIYKFNYSKNYYYLIIRNINTNEYDVIERCQCHHNTQNYGYLWNNNYLDNLNIGDTIKNGDVIKRSNGFDKYGNKMNGTNLTTLYISSAQNMEDSVIISETAAKKLESSLIKTATIIINDNDILLNLYGKDNEYKSFPDIGEYISNGMLCSIRRENNDTVLYSLSQSNLKSPYISDRCIILDGYVADISVYCNNKEALKSSYNTQLYKYYEENIDFCKRFVNAIKAQYVSGTAKLSYKLNKLYSNCQSILNGKTFQKDGKEFSNTILEITVIENLPTKPGDKICDRYGGKGVISKIVPDELMPKLENGKYVECIKNQSTCINRENIGQLHEQSINYISTRLIEYLKDDNVLTPMEKVQMIYKLISMIDKDEAIEMMSYVDFYDEMQCKCYLDSIYKDGYICISSQPFTTPIEIGLISEIYDEFPFLKRMYKLYTKMEDSNGNLREVLSNRKVIAAPIYTYRLKQYAEEKFSVTSLGSVNIKGMNTRSKANKIYEDKNTKTPIQFGPMEITDMLHMGIEHVVILVVNWAASPSARRKAHELIVGDPFDIDIKLDMYSTNRNAEAIQVLFTTMGIGFRFYKIKKQNKEMVKNIMIKPVKRLKPRTNILDIINMQEYYNCIQYDNAINIKSINDKYMIKNIMCKMVNKNDDKNIAHITIQFK